MALAVQRMGLRLERFRFLAKKMKTVFKYLGSLICGFLIGRGLVIFAKNLTKSEEPTIFHLTTHDPPIAYRVKKTRTPSIPHKNAGLEEELIIWATEISWTGKPPDAVHRPDLTVTEVYTGKTYVISQPYDIETVENILRQEATEWGTIPNPTEEQVFEEIRLMREDYEKSLKK